MNRRVLRFAFLTFGVMIGFETVHAQAYDRRLPDEYETVGGHGLALGNMGVGALSGISAIRVNPALLSLEKTYSMAAGYNWPTYGRDFYNAGIVDSQSSKIAAAFIYTGFGEKYDPSLANFDKDSPVERRASLALAQSLGLLSAGISAHYVEAESLDPTDQEKIKGTSIGFGLASLLTPRIRMGISGENLANKKIADYAPRTFRAGIAVLFANGDVTAHLDLRQRDRIARLEQGLENESSLFGEELSLSEREKIQEEDRAYEQPERMVFASVSARVYDAVRLLGSYGQNITGSNRQSLSGGAAIVSGNFSLSYCASRPYMNEPESQQAINFSFAVNL